MLHYDYKDVLGSPIQGSEPGHHFGALVGKLNVEELLHEIGGEVNNVQLTDDIISQDWMQELHQKSVSITLTQERVDLITSLDRYVGMSLMQKGIRRRIWPHTFVAVCSMFANGRGSDCVRRLKVIALEDIGNGDPMSASLALLLLSSKRIRQVWPLNEVCLMAGRILTHAWKSRDLCDLNSYAWMDESVFIEATLIKKDTVDKIKQRACDKSEPFKTRMAAFACLWPVKELSGMKGEGIEDRMDVYLQLGCPASVVYASENCYKGTGSFFGLGWPFVAEMTQPNGVLGSDVFPIDNECDERGLLYAALDRHTSKGKRSILAWSKWKPLKGWFADHPDVVEKDSILRTDFYTSAGLLNPRIDYPGWADLYYQILDIKGRTTGFENLDEVLDLFNLAVQSRETLNYLRSN